MADHKAPTALSDDDLANVTGGKGQSDSGLPLSLGEGKSLEDMLKAIQQERLDTLEEWIKAQVGEVKAHQSTIGELNQGLSVLKTAEKALEAHGPDAQVSLKSLATDWGNRSVDELTKVLGLSANAVQDGALNKKELESAITGVQTKIDTVTSEAQMDMIKLQSLMDKQRQASDQMNDLLAKFKK